MIEHILMILPWLLALTMLGFWLRSEHLYRLEKNRLIDFMGKDNLTNLSNRRHFLELAARETNRSQRFNTPLTALIIDVDDLRHLNNTYGHVGGDLALKHLAEACRQSVRDFDLIGRFSGEEIALVLPDTPLDGAIVVAERIRKKVTEARVTMPDGIEFTMTVCIGVAQTKSEMDNLEDLLLAADVALQRAMEYGLNNVMY